MILNTCVKLLISITVSLLISMLQPLSATLKWQNWTAGFHTCCSSQLKSQQPKYYFIWKDNVAVFGLNICLNNYPHSYRQSWNTEPGMYLIISSKVCFARFCLSWRERGSVFSQNTASAAKTHWKKNTFRQLHFPDTEMCFGLWLLSIALIRRGF